MGLGGVTKHCSLEGAMLHHPNGDTKSSPLIFILGGGTHCISFYCQKFSGFKENKGIILEFLKLKVQNQDVGEAAFPLGASEGESISFFFF